MTITRITGRHVLIATLAFFGIVIGVNATLITYAVGTFSGEEEKDAYQKGLNYNQTLARRSAETASAMTAEVSVSRGSDATAHVAVVIRERGAEVRGLAVKAYLRHPTDSHLDREADMASEGAGAYAGYVDDVTSGAWDVVIVATREGATVLESRNRTWLP